MKQTEISELMDQNSVLSTAMKPRQKSKQRFNTNLNSKYSTNSDASMTNITNTILRNGTTASLRQSCTLKSLYVSQPKNQNDSAEASSILKAKPENIPPALTKEDETKKLTPAVSPYTGQPAGQTQKPKLHTRKPQTNGRTRHQSVNRAATAQLHRPAPPAHCKENGWGMLDLE